MSDQPADAAAPATDLDAERQRLAEGRADGVRWDLWGPYLAERQWGTVREDYSPDGEAWRSFPARPRPLPGLSLGGGRPARHQRRPGPPLLRPRPLERQRPHPQGTPFRPDSGPEGNHGEDVKEAYYYLDATPTSSYLKALYKYPQRAFPYAELVAENRPARPGRAGVRAARHRRLRRRSLLRRPRRVRQGGARRHPHPPQRDESRSASRRRSTCCRPSGSATSGPGAPSAIGRCRRYAPAACRRDCSWRSGAPAGAGHARPPRRVLAGLRRRAGAALHREREQPPAPVGRAEPDAVRQGRDRRRRRQRPRRGGRPGPDRHQGRRPLRRSSCRRGRPRRSCSASARHDRRSQRADPFAGAEQVFAARIAEADAFYAPLAAGLDDGGPARSSARPTPGSSGASSSTTTTSASGSTAIPPVRRRQPSPQARPQRRLAPPQQRRRHLHARHLGVPLVRRLGPRLPLRAVRPHRSRVSPSDS